LFVLEASTVSSNLRETREKVEKEMMERRKRGDKGDRRRTKEMKFILANLLYIEWKVFYYYQSTESSFIRNILLPLSEKNLSIEEEEEEEEEKASLPPDSLNGDSLILSTIRDSSLSYSSHHADLLCCSERKVLFGNILSHSSFPFPPSTRLSSLNILENLFHHESTEEVKWVMREGGVIVVLRKMREKKEREDEVMKCNVNVLNEFLHSSEWERKRRREEMKGMKEWREEMWKIEKEGGSDSLFSLLHYIILSESVLYSSLKRIIVHGMNQMGVIVEEKE
jgi:hypothetical protein